MNTEEIDKFLDAISVWNNEIEDYSQKIEIAKKKKSDIVGELIKEVQVSSFEHKGKWYLLKTMKKSGHNSITEMGVKPGSWLKKESDKDSDS